MLIYLLHQEEKVAIAGSLAVVGAVAAAGAVDAARRGAVAWRAVALFGGAGFVGSAIGAGGRAFLRGDPAHSVRPRVAGGSGSDGLSPCSPANRRPRAVARRRSAGKMLLDGLLVGALTGYVVGGGFLIVPALTLLGGLPMFLATGTSLVVIAANAGSGFV